MSFAEKIAGLMARPNQDAVPKDDVPWWMKYAGRGLGTVGGFIAIFLGVWNCVGIMLAQVMCFLSGMMQMCAGFMVIVCEAPCCCMFVDFVQNLSDWVERRPYWHKAALYVIMAIPPIIMCPSLASIFGSGLIFATGVIYGMMSLGKKASAEEMRTAANNLSQPPQTKDISSNMRSNLVDNAQPVAFTGMPIDSNV
ncbi:calcium channel flower isoform X1 [Ctenocephalides felis]|uniref:calcium channel flower isoform X1 n=1 Tax=Ctenocephalides felis TaxID=7515 RepID=UPI000E6E4CBE|nr:calcium channel flower isoform X1 [Ctenocephalides felis]